MRENRTMFSDSLAMHVTSPDFHAEDRLPEVFSASGGSRAPRLEVEGVPVGSVELAVIAHDPDAPRPLGFTHWTLYGIPARDGAIDPDVGRPGPNDAGGLGWTGPNPPAGHGLHHYFVFAFALSRSVEGEPTRDEFLHGYADAIVAVSRIVGTYSA